MTHFEIDELIAISDPDGVWAMMQDFQMYDAAEYIELKYFD